jgi:hypothetical protein
MGLRIQNRSQAACNCYSRMKYSYSRIRRTAYERKLKIVFIEVRAKRASKNNKGIERNFN